MSLDTPLDIGAVRLSNRVIAAPLAGISHLPFRLLAKQAGCGLVCSEMISANGLQYQSPKTFAMLKSVAAEKPLSVQLFGADADILAEAARTVAANGADIVDINFGCAVKKVVKTGSGVALMHDPENAKKILKAVRAAIAVPLTVKMRSGWDHTGRQARQLAQMAQDCGVDAVAIHPRTAGQGFGGKADWPLIAAVKKLLSIPVIGNGDIFSAADAGAMLASTGCDGIMIGRAAIGNPWIFAQVRALLAGGNLLSPGIGQHFDVMRRYLDAAVDHFGEIHACRMMRSQLGWFTKGLPHSSAFRESIKEITTRAAALGHLNQYQNRLEDRLKGEPT